MSSVKGVKNGGETHLVEYTAPVGRSSTARFCGFLPGVVGHMSGPQGSRGLSPQVTGGLFFSFCFIADVIAAFSSAHAAGAHTFLFEKVCKANQRRSPFGNPPAENAVSSGGKLCCANTVVRHP